MDKKMGRKVRSIYLYLLSEHNPDIAEATSIKSRVDYSLYYYRDREDRIKSYYNSEGEDVPKRKPIIEFMAKYLNAAQSKLKWIR